MKKIISSVVAMLMVLCMLVILAPATAFAAENPTIVVSSASNFAGTEVKLTIGLENNPGIAFIKVHLQFDTSKLSIVSIEDAGSFVSATFNEVGGVMMWDQDAEMYNVTEDCILGTVTLKIADDLPLGEVIPVTVTYANVDGGELEIFDIDFVPVEFDIAAGSVTVGEPGPNPISDLNMISTERT